MHGQQSNEKMLQEGGKEREMGDAGKTHRRHSNIQRDELLLACQRKEERDEKEINLRPVIHNDLCIHLTISLCVGMDWSPETQHASPCMHLLFPILHHYQLYPMPHSLLLFHA